MYLLTHGEIHLKEERNRKKHINETLYLFSLSSYRAYLSYCGDSGRRVNASGCDHVNESCRDDRGSGHGSDRDHESGSGRDHESGSGRDHGSGSGHVNAQCVNGSS